MSEKIEAESTPMTDAATFWGRDMSNDSGPPHFKCVDADEMKKVEKQLAEARQEVEMLKDILAKYWIRCQCTVGVSAIMCEQCQSVYEMMSELPEGPTP